MLKNEIAFNSHSDGLRVAQILLNEGYVVMLSYEEKLLIVNYEWSEHYSDRNDMVFMHRGDFEGKYCELVDEDEKE